MKLLKVRIVRGKADENAMVYPAAYDAQQVDREGVYSVGLPVQDGLSGGIGLGDAEEWCLIALNDAVADQYALDPDMEIVSLAQANTLLADWRTDRLARGAHGERAERITDQQALDLARTRKEAGLATTLADTAALDPDDPALGINKGPRTVPLRVTSQLA